MPLPYLPVSSPCAKGEKQMMPLPLSAAIWKLPIFAFGSSIERGSVLVNDSENGHNRLVRELGLVDERYDSKLIKGLPDRENPLRDVNRLCYLLKLFLDSHSGFDRSDVGGYLDVFWVMMNPPADKMEKAAFVLDRAMSVPISLSFRDFYGIR